MPDYAKMYKTLFCSQTNAISVLQEAQQITEEMYISSPKPDLKVIPLKEQKEEPKKEI